VQPSGCTRFFTFSGVAPVSRNGWFMETKWVYFFLFILGGVFSYASYADSPRKKIYRIIAISIIIYIFVLAKFGD
jgi:uncharacterized membrane protein YjdF